MNDRVQKNPDLKIAATFLKQSTDESMATPLRAGIIGLDTSHVKVFTEMWNLEEARDHIPGVRGGGVSFVQPGCAQQPERIEGFKRHLSQDLGVRLVASIAELVEQVDAVLIESVDGRRHLPELRELLASKAGGQTGLYR